jgi:hypothetical protein
MFYIYGYFEPDYNNPFYIGKGSRLRRRKRHLEHMSDFLIEKNDIFHKKLKSMKRKGIKPIIKILFDNLEEDIALELEILLIKKYGKRVDETGCLCNMTDGGEGISGHRHTEETRKKMSKSQSGHIKSDESILKQRESLTGHKHTEEDKIKMIKIMQEIKGWPIESYNLITLITIKQYNSICEAEKDGYSISCIRRTLKGLQFHHHGLGWRHQTREQTNTDWDNPEYFANQPFEE